MIKSVENVVDIRNIQTENGKEIFYAKFGNLIHFGADTEKQQAFEKYKLSAKQKEVNDDSSGGVLCG